MTESRPGPFEEVIVKVQTTAARAGWAVAALVWGFAGFGEAHHSLTQFDTETAVRIEGVIVRFERVNPHSYLYVDRVDGQGRVEHWAVEGPSLLQLNRAALGEDMLRPGSTIQACGYVLKARNPPPEGVSARLLVAEQLVTPDGGERVWSDYGRHLCLGTDYPDIHTR